MLDFFTDPYPDELLFSAVSRYHYYSGNEKIRDTNHELHNDFYVSLGNDNLNELIEKLGGSYNREELIFNNTLFPFYYFFDKRLEYNNSYLLFHNKDLYFCPECLKNDIEKYGEAYFHREHQLEDVLVCPKHMAVLLPYVDGKTKKYENFYRRLDIGKVEIKNKQIMDTSKYDKLFQILNLYCSILSCKPNRCINNDVLNYYWNKVLREKGFITHDGINNLESEIINFYGDDTLRILDKDYNKFLHWNGYKNYKGEFRGFYLYKPLHHIIIMKFLGKSINDIISDIEKDHSRFITEYSRDTLWFDTFMSYVNKGFTLTCISSIMDISIYKVWELAKKLNIEHDIKTGNLYVSDEEHEIYRKQCLELIKTNPGISRSELAKLLKSKYRSILSSSRTWWEENAPPLKNNKVKEDKHNNSPKTFI